MRTASLFLLAALAVPPLQAQPATAAAAPVAATAAAGFVEAEVRRVDRDAGKVTLRHGAIANLDMPPMTMVFEAVQPAQLEGLKPGDKVLFRAEKQDGRYLAAELRRAP